MKMMPVVALSLCIMASGAQAQETTLAAEAFTNALYKRLAKTRNALLIDAPAETAAVLGRLYMYQNPKCTIPSSNYITKGKPISLDAFDSPIDVSDITRTLREPKQIGSYSISRGMAAELIGDIKATGVLDAKISPKLMIEAMSKARVSFRVIRSEVDFVSLQRRLAEKPIATGMLPAEYEGVLVPIAHFSIADFVYEVSKGSDSGASLAAEASLVNNLLSELKANFSARQKSLSDSETRIDSSATFAFKPAMVTAKHKKCSLW